MKSFLQTKYMRFMKNLQKISFLTFYNRAKFNDIKNYKFARSRRYKIPLSLCMLDIDDFKKINDNFGHLVGDKVLKEVGHIILNNTRRADLPFRWGGEEFLIMFTNTSASKAEIACKKLLNIIRSAEVKKGTIL